LPAVNYREGGVYIIEGRPVDAASVRSADNSRLPALLPPDVARTTTMAYRILLAHHQNGSSYQEPALHSQQTPQPSAHSLHLHFDALISHDITYVGIIQTARAAGLQQFPLPYALTNCHNSLCAVGGTINEDDHVFGLSAAHRYGGIYVPANQAVIHQFAREKLVAVGQMILGSDSHTRYGCFGCMGIGEGGGELVKQLLANSYDLAPPPVVLVWLEGSVPFGIGPHDVALALIRETFPEGRVKNMVLEFAGPALSSLPIDFRCGIDVMTTETGCLSSIWQTDQITDTYYHLVGRPQATGTLKLREGSYYDHVVRVDLSRVQAMIALPFHPSNVYSIHELQAHPVDILGQATKAANQELGGGASLDLLRHLDDTGQILCDQGVIVGCAGGLYDNISVAAQVLAGGSIGNGYFDLSVYPASEPINLAITTDGSAQTLIQAGAVVKPAFCGPCFGAGDTPANNSLSIRHATRNFASREGSKPQGGQIAAVALMDARSIAATALAQGRLTAASDLELDVFPSPQPYSFDDGMYAKRCYFGFGQPEPNYPLRLGPNIADWPPIPALGEHLLLELAAVIHDPVTTTDELIPSGETSSYRSNPLALAEFTLSRREPQYVPRAKAIAQLEQRRQVGQLPEAISELLCKLNVQPARTAIASALFATKPGDGSAREQAASSQRILGGAANIAYEYATKRYRSNCINWGILPFTLDARQSFDYTPGDLMLIRDVRAHLLAGAEEFRAQLISGPDIDELSLHLRDLSSRERDVLAAGCLINYYAAT
jgi:aconitate hydratase